MKGLMKACSDGSAMWTGWRGKGLLCESMCVEYLKKRGLGVRQARRIFQDRSEWREFVRGNVWGVARGMNP